MKQILTILILLTVSFSLAGCGSTSSRTPSDITEVNLPDGVYMTLQDASSDGISVILHNETDMDYIYGYDYRLEVLVKGRWEVVDTIIENVAFPAVGISLFAQTTADVAEDWTVLHGSQPAGTYRFLKTLIPDDGPPAEQYWLAVEFTIS